ncbi:hypothetical protein CCM_08812 [Cordyceps militaris CM01]|uniref:Uncharacterized protein n=1 Tax=Cordyceps militaris (strain CM01) TaxID=983644 RepID=G3JSH4_CORMM|nr:uncharacterized protein CCM_08812 [Cordyceps militaris CM01]EGX88766.1 hypothetical protein CCM_08812 [Cordyceps militaris CM01]
MTSVYSDLAELAPSIGGCVRLQARLSYITESNSAPHTVLRTPRRTSYCFSTFLDGTVTTPVCRFPPSTDDFHAAIRASATTQAGFPKSGPVPTSISNYTLGSDLLYI